MLLLPVFELQLGWWIVGEGVAQESLCPSSGFEKKEGSVCSMQCLPLRPYTF